MIYVSTEGTDEGDGSKADPVATISAALGIVRQKRAAGDNREWHIMVESGTYSIENTISLTNADSGRAGAPLVIEAADHKNPPRLTGGEDISFSELSAASASVRERIGDTQGKVMQLDLAKKGITDYGEISRRGHLVTEGKIAQMMVSVDGEDMRLAAYPNEGWITLTDSEVVKSSPRNESGIAQGAAFTYSDSRIDNWQQPELAWVSGSLGYNFDYDYYPIGSVDTTKKTVTLREGAIVTKTEYANKYSNHIFRYENVLEELDAPGEYYIDRENGMLYIYPPEGSTAASTLTLSMLGENMIEINQAHDITFKNIEMHSGRRTALTTVGGGERIKVEDCKIHGFGRDGISLSLNTGSAVHGCEIFDIGENAVNIRGGDYTNIVSSGNVVEENEIYRFAQLERSYKTGIMVGTESVGTVVRHNYIHDAPHAGIIFYGVNNLFENNHIERVVTEFSDMDAIYADNHERPWERGNVIKSNYFGDIGNSITADGKNQLNVRAIRMDNSGHGLEVCQNVFYNIGKNANNNGVFGVCAQGTYHNIHENLFVDCSGSYYANMTYNPERKYDMTTESRQNIKKQLGAKLPIYGVKFEELNRFWEEHPQAVRTNKFNNNIVVNISSPLSAINGTINAEGFVGAVELVDASGNLVTDTDPGFKDYKGRDFSIVKNSAAWETVSGKTDFNIECKGRK